MRRYPFDVATPTQQEIDDLEDALRSGAKTVKHGDKLIGYREIAEMREELARMKRRAKGAAGRRPTRAKVRCSRGY